LGLARSQRNGLAFATTLIHRVCEIAGEENLIEDVRASFQERGLVEAIHRHDNDAIFQWLADAISYQGVSDRVARTYIEAHGAIRAEDIRIGLSQPGLCPKLTSYWHFERCGYRKAAKTCSQPRLLPTCPLARHDLRNGSLNQAAYHLFLFMRDVAGGDFVGWLDRRLEAADTGRGRIRATRLCRSIVEPLRHIHGVSDKVLNMTLAYLLLAGDPAWERWVTAGANMTAVDSLVHNWVHRSGILKALSANHIYGPLCYRPGGCADIIERVAARIDAMQFNPSFPRRFPRFVQKAIWNFCAADEVGQCNGTRFDDRARYSLIDCSIYSLCQRVALKPPA
jgi:hypothetical protein